MVHKGGCGCTGGRRHTRKHRKHAKKGGSMVGDAILAGTAMGLYSYFKKKGGTRKGSGRRLPARKTRKELV
jgi:hypothetical protein